jgi:hypothetical protein
LFRYNFGLSRRQQAETEEKAGQRRMGLATRVTKVSLAQNSKG